MISWTVKELLLHRRWLTKTQPWIWLDRCSCKHLMQFVLCCKYEYLFVSMAHMHVWFNPNKTGGPWWPPPPSTFCVITLQHAKLSPRPFRTIFFRVSRTFWHQICDARGVRFWSYITFCTCTSDRKRLKMWFCVQNQCNLVFFTYVHVHVVHINMLIFTLNGWN